MPHIATTRWAAVWLGDRLLTLAAGLAAAIPVIVATVEALQAGWAPVADRAIIATRAHDVFTSHMPLVGQYTLAGEVTGKVTHSLGPMLFWLLAPAAYNGSDAGMTITIGALNTLCVVGCVALARRRGGRALMVMTAAAIALMCQSLAAETFHDVWNPSAGLFPFTLLIFLCWSLACGEYRLLPLTALVASFVVQAHLTYLPPTIALLAVGLGGLAVGAIAEERRRKRGASGERRISTSGEQQGGTPGERRDSTSGERQGGTPGERRISTSGERQGGTPGERRISTSGERRDSGRWSTLIRHPTAIGWALATLLVVALCWSATIDGQLTEHPGNLTLVAESATKHKPTLGAEVGWHAVVDAVGVTPWWLRTPRSRWQRKHEVRSQPSALAKSSTIALLAALLLTATVALARRRRDVATLALIALALCPALGAVAASTPVPRRLSATLGYTLWWGSQAGMIAWLALAWALLVALVWAAREARRVVLARRAPTDPEGTVARDSITGGRVARRKRGRLAVVGSTILTLAGIGAAAAVGGAVAAQGTPDEHAVTYKPIEVIDARLADLIPRGGSVLLEGELDGATMPIKPAVRYFLVTRGTRVLAPGSFLRLGSWYELYKRPYREAIYLSDVPRPPVERAALAFDVSFREGRKLNTVYVWRSRRPGR